MPWSSLSYFLKTKGGIKDLFKKHILLPELIGENSNIFSSSLKTVNTLKAT